MDSKQKIYIARGDDLLGPYDPVEADRLLRSGYLKPTDYAARDGDPDWVPLLQLVPVEASLLPGTPAAPRTLPAADHALMGESRPRSLTRGVRFALLGLALLVLVVVIALFGRSHRPPAPMVAKSSPTPARTTPPSSPSPPLRVTPALVVASPSLPAPIAPPLVAASPLPSSPPPLAVPSRSATPPPPAQPDCHLEGTLSLAGRDGQPSPFAGAHVAAYPLDSLAPLLVEKKAHVQVELDRLTPQLTAAEAERNAKLGEEQEARQTYLDASPNDPLIYSLHFAATQAKQAVASAQSDYQFLLAERKEALDGAFYFRDLPPPAVETQTDSDGRYTLDFPAGGSFVVAAFVQRTTASGIHPHYWLVRVTLADGETHSLPLTDTNVASAHSPDSLLETAD